MKNLNFTLKNLLRTYPLGADFGFLSYRQSLTGCAAESGLGFLFFIVLLALAGVFFVRFLVVLFVHIFFFIFYLV